MQRCSLELIGKRHVTKVILLDKGQCEYYDSNQLRRPPPSSDYLALAKAIQRAHWPEPSPKMKFCLSLLQFRTLEPTAPHDPKGNREPLDRFWEG